MILQFLSIVSHYDHDLPEMRSLQIKQDNIEILYFL